MAKLFMREVGKEAEGLWTTVGDEANQDREEFKSGNLIWPELNRIEEGKEGHLYLIADIQGKHVGRLLMKSKPDVDTSIILDVCVQPDYRRRGIGRKLIEYAVDKAKKWGKDKICWSHYVDEEDETCLSFFDRLGFKGTECYSVIIDLVKPSPELAVERAERLYGQGFRIRQLKSSESDIELASSLQERYFGRSASSQGVSSIKETRVEIERLIRKGFIILVSEKGEKTAGFVMGAANCTTKNWRQVRVKGEGLLTSIAVVEEFRRIGVATSLVLELGRILRGKGNRTLLYGGVGYGGQSMKTAQGAGGMSLRKHYSFLKVL